MLSPRHQLDCLSVRLTGLSRPQYHHSRLHKAPLIHRGSASSESVSFVETANDNWNRIEWVFSPQSDLPGPLSNSRMLKNSTLGFGQSVRVLECLACKADHEHCCLDIGVSIRAEGQDRAFVSLGYLGESGTLCLSRDTRAVLGHSSTSKSLCHYLTPLDTWINVDMFLYSIAILEGGVALGDVLAAPWLNVMGDLSRSSPINDL